MACTIVHEEFKNIKSLDDKSFRNLYEMSQDGKIVRSIADRDYPLPLIPGTTVKVELVDGTGKKKSFGLKTLYWASWNKPLPGGAVEGLEVKAVIKPQRGKKVESSLTVKQGVLLSKYVLGKVNELIQRRADKGLSAEGQELSEEKSQSLRIILHKQESKMALVHVDSQNWRDGYWFLDLASGKHLAFEDGKHRRNGLMGDENILWPENLGA